MWRRQGEIANVAARTYYPPPNERHCLLEKKVRSFRKKVASDVRSFQTRSEKERWGAGTHLTAVVRQASSCPAARHTISLPSLRGAAALAAERRRRQFRVTMHPTAASATTRRENRVQSCQWDRAQSILSWLVYVG